jgi:hypothetical protein
MRPAVSEPNGQCLVALTDLCMEMAADVVALYARHGDADAAAVRTRRSVRMARVFGLLKEEKS